MNLGAPEIILIIVAVLLLFGYKKLPDASRSIGRSLRIFKGEMKDLKDDDARSHDADVSAPVHGEIVTAGNSPAGGVGATRLAEEAAAAEARAAELRARADAALAAERTH